MEQNERSSLSVGAVARRLEVSPSTVWRWVSVGVRGHRLEARLIGSRWRTSEAALSRFLEALNAGRVSQLLWRTK